MILYFKRYNVILCTVILTLLIINKILNLLRYNNNIPILHYYYNYTVYHILIVVYVATAIMTSNIYWQGKKLFA